MNENRIMGSASIVLGAGLAVIALLGPLGSGWIDYRISDNMERQLIAIDGVAIFLVAPVAAAAGLLWWRGRRLAPVVAFGPALYAVYFLFQDILTPEYLRYDGNNEQFFPLIYAVLLLGLMVSVKAWFAIDTQGLPVPARRLQLATAIVLIGFGSLLALGWISWLAEIIGGNTSQIEYQEHPAASWLVKTVDLTFLVPALIVTGVGLLRERMLAVKAAYLLTGALTLLAAAVAGMGVIMVLQDDPSTEPVFAVVTVPLTFILAALTLFLWRTFDSSWRTRQRVAATPPDARNASAQPSLRHHK